MVDLARYFISFTQDESCGKCTPCREGTERMNEILAAICEGRATGEDLALLEELAEYVKDTSLCGLGATAPNPVLTTLNYFRDEYEAHVHHRQCPARACPSLSPAPCQGACPAGIDVPSYVALIAAGEYQQALDLIREDNPLPAICGYVCTHPCEGMCKRRDVDQAVAIKHLKRAVADWEMEQGIQGPKPAPRKGKPVAVIGAGPAGLTAAHFLSRAGHPVTVFESAEEPGGMLVAGIPGFRLPREVIRYEITRIQQLGVEIRTGVRVGRDISLEQIREEGFAAVYLSIGAYREMKLAVPGEEELEGISGSLAFLERFNRGEREPLSGQVLVVGGGNAAIDCARAAQRLGPEQVTVVYRRSREEMPADPAEILEAEREGVQIRVLSAPVRVEGEGGRVTGLQCIETKLGEPDESSRRRPVPVEGSEFTLPADRIITAIGQQPDPAALQGLEGVRLARGNRITIDPETQRTDLEWLFAGGDAVTGPATVIEAVGAGKMAARAIRRYLADEDVREHAPVPIPRRRVEEALDMDEDEVAALARVEMPTAPVPERLGQGVLVEQGLEVERARREAHRCLRCDINR
jgi:NADH-quinone oxidoreductase subunit F